MIVNKLEMHRITPTKNTERYVAPDKEDGSKQAVTQLYIQKDAFGGKEAPGKISVSIEALAGESEIKPGPADIEAAAKGQ